MHRNTPFTPSSDTSRDVASRFVSSIRNVSTAEGLKSLVRSKTLIESFQWHVANAFFEAGVPAEAIVLEADVDTALGTHIVDVAVTPCGFDRNSEVTIAAEMKSQTSSVARNRRNHAYSLLGMAAEHHALHHRRVVGWFDVVLTAEPIMPKGRSGTIKWKETSAPADRLRFRQAFGCRRANAKPGVRNEAAEAYGLMVFKPGERGGVKMLRTPHQMLRAEVITEQEFAELAANQRERSAFDVTRTVDQLLSIHKRRFGNILT